MELAIALFLLAVALAVVYGGYRAFRQLMKRAAELSEPEPEPVAEEVAVSGEVGADGLVYLFAHDFVVSKAAPPNTPSRDRAFAPLSGAELDPEDWALQIVYAVLAELHREECVEFRVVERAATLMPPFAQKSWELEIIQRGPFLSCPLADAMEVAFDLMRRRRQARVAQGKQEPEELWCPLDEIVEKTLKVMRQEMSFWERTGIYGDLRNYVASALMAQGYIISPGRETWIDRGRLKRIRPNEPACDNLRAAAATLKRHLQQFRLKHGSPQAIHGLEPEGRLSVRDADPELVNRETDLATMPLDDILRISLFEALCSLRQLEPSRDAGV